MKIHTPKTAAALAISVLVLLFGATTSAHAQTLTSFDLNRPGASLEFSPEFPRPGAEVTVKLKQFISEPKFLLVTWRLNGEVVLKGYEETKYSFTAGPAGSLVVIEADIVDREGRTATAKKTFRISDVAFLWEARSYTPPFFLGRPKLSYGAPVVVIANPTIYSLSGRQYDPAELSYVWTQGMKEIQSGVGKNTFESTPASPFSNVRIHVRITDPEGELRMVDEINMMPVPPKITVYEDSPLLGVLYRSAIPDTYDLIGEELRLVAEPFYTTVESRADPSLTYTWDINNETYDYAGMIVLRPEGGLSGSTNISLTVLNSEYFLQRLQKRMSVTYNTEDAGRAWTDSSPTTNAL